MGQFRVRATQAMEIFIGSSRQSLETVRRVGSWLQSEGHQPLSWDQPGLFPVGEYTWDSLDTICRRVGAAVFVFGEDDRVWYRADGARQPRDNVLIEYGLFAGVLGRRKVGVCKVGSPRVPVDLAGLTVVDMNLPARQAKAQVAHWLRRMSADEADVPLDTGGTRQPKLRGRWKGRIEQPEYPGGAISFEMNLEFQADRSPTKGRAWLSAGLSAAHRGGPLTVRLEFVLLATFRHSQFVKLEYWSDDTGMIQFGTMVLRMNDQGNELRGRLVGYGSVSEAVISGLAVFKKAVTRSHALAKGRR